MGTMIVQEEGMETDDILDMSTLVDISIQTGLTWNLLAQMEKELDRYTDASSQTEMTGKQVEQIVCRYSALAKHKKKKCHPRSGQVTRTSSVSTRDGVIGFVTDAESGMDGTDGGFDIREPSQHQAQLRAGGMDSVITEQGQTQASKLIPEQMEGRRVTRRSSRQTGVEVTSADTQEKALRISENSNKTSPAVANAEPSTPREIEVEQREQGNVVSSGTGGLGNVEKNKKNVNPAQGVQKRKVGRPRKKTYVKPVTEVPSSQAERNDISVREIPSLQAERNDISGTVSGAEGDPNSVAAKGRSLRNRKVATGSQSNVRRGARENSQSQDDGRWDLASPEKLLEMGLYCVSDIKQEVVSEHGDNSPEPRYVSIATDPCDRDELYNVTGVDGERSSPDIETSREMAQSGANRPTQGTGDALPVMLSVDRHGRLNSDPHAVISTAAMEVGNERSGGSLLLTCVDEPVSDPSPLYLTRVLSCNEDSPSISQVERSPNEAEFIAISRSLDNAGSSVAERRQAAVVEVAGRGSPSHASDLGTLQTINTFQHNGSLYYGSLLKTEVGTEYLVWQPDSDAADPEEDEMSIINPKSAALMSTSAGSTIHTVEEDDELGVVLNGDPKSAMTMVLHQNTGTDSEVAGPSRENAPAETPVKRGRGRPKGSTKKRHGAALKTKTKTFQSKSKAAEEPQVTAAFKNKTSSGSTHLLVKPFVGPKSKKLERFLSRKGSSVQQEEIIMTDPIAAENDIEESGKDLMSSNDDLTMTHLKPIGRTKKWYQCTYCNYTTVHYSTWRRHEARHLDIRQFECPMCGRQFITKWNLQLHMKTHDKKKGHMCPQCSEIFAYKTQLERHVRQVHLKGKERVCPFCEKKFMGRDSFKEHMKTHE